MQDRDIEVMEKSPRKLLFPPQMGLGGTKHLAGERGEGAVI